MAEQVDSTPGSMNRDSSVVDQVAGILDAIDTPIQEVKPEKKAKEKPEPIAKVEDHDEEGDLPLPELSNEEDEEQEGTDKEEKTEDEDEEQDTSDEEVTWAKVLGIDENKIVLDDNGDFSGFKVKVDGKLEIVPVDALLSGYQNNKSNTNKSRAIAEERKQIEEHKLSILTEYGKKLKDAEALTQYLETSMLEEFQNVDWNNLRYQNPGEYSAMVQDYNLKTARIEQIKNAIGTVVTEENQKINSDIGQKSQEFVKAQVEKAIDNNPEWKDEKVFKKALINMQNFVSESYGFTAQEFAEVKDARILELIKDAQKYRMGKTVAEKKVEKKVPKYQKPIGTTTKSLTKLERLVKAAKTTTGHSQLEAQKDAVAELMRNL
jgi:hypothetical protein